MHLMFALDMDYLNESVTFVNLNVRMSLYMEVQNQKEHYSYHPVFSGTVHVSQALSSRLISSSIFARSQVFSLIFLVMTNFTSAGSFSNISVDVKAPNFPFRFLM